MKKIVIIGGVAGGASAAARIRRLDEQAEIIMLERSGYVSYANCGLPYYIGGEIEDKSKLTLQTPQSFKNRFGIDVRVRHEAQEIDVQRKLVRVKNLETGEVEELPYDKLVLSPGARPSRPNLPGVEDEAVLTLRTVEDTFHIREFVERRAPKSAVVVGGGYIGLEMAENLIRLGVQVTILEMAEHVLAPLDYDMACEVHAYLRSKGVELMRRTTVTGFSRQGDRLFVSLQDAQPLPADLVILATGVTPETTLAKEAGLELGLRGAIVVDEHMRTSNEDIYAVGDAVQVRHFVSGAPVLLPLAGPANKQGRIAADNICGKDSRFEGSQGSSIVKIFDMTVATTGLNETSAKAQGLPCDKVRLYSASHATYYPGATNMSIKVVFSPQDGKILGAQIVGFEGVDKRIDVLATAIRAGLTAIQLKDLDLAYAPPYSSAKDPVNMAGFMAENLAEGIVKQFWIEDVASLPRDGSVTLLDLSLIHISLCGGTGGVEYTFHIQIHDLVKGVLRVFQEGCAFRYTGVVYQNIYTAIFASRFSKRVPD